MQYGLPYKGSKTKIADTIIEHIPPAKVFYDLFAGGCAVSHAALLSGKWERVVANDIAAYPKMFMDAARGRYRNDYRWVSREDFFNSTDPFDRLVFSFGNDCRTYIYGEEIEPFKRAMHYAVCFGDYAPMKELGIDLSPIDECKTMKQRRLKAFRIIAAVRDRTASKWYDCNIHLENLERLERLQNLERLERISDVSGFGTSKNIDRMEAVQGSYDAVPIVGDSVIYCDIPYVSTNGYGKSRISDFDYDTFYDWAAKQTVPVYVSEYWMPPDLFECILEIKTLSLICADSPTEAIERLFVPKGAIYPKTTLF